MKPALITAAIVAIVALAILAGPGNPSPDAPRAVTMASGVQGVLWGGLIWGSVYAILDALEGVSTAQPPSEEHRSSGRGYRGKKAQQRSNEE